MVEDPKAIKVFGVMMDRGLIPKTGPFEITDKMLDASYMIYQQCFPPKGRKKRSPSDIRLSRKICGLNLMKLLKSRQVADSKPSRTVKLDTKAGFVYVISNPAFPGKYKVGMTTDIESRLATYQTYDPNRLFKVERYMFVEDRREVEKEILRKYSVDIDKGEWVSTEKVIEMFV